MRAPWVILVLLGCTLPKPNTMNGLDSHHVRAWTWGTEITVDQATASFVAETNGYTWGLLLVGDVNGDGIDDVIVGGELRVYLLYGRTEGWMLDESWTGKPSIVGTVDQNPAWAVRIGDVNGDGLADVGIDHDGGNWTEEYLMLGSKDPWPAELPVDDVDVVAQGEAMTVYQMGPVGDVDGDGLDDWLLTADDPDGHDAYVLSGAALAGEVPFPGPAVALSVHGELPGGLTDYDAIGDFTGDGLSDLGADIPDDPNYYIVPGTSVPIEGLAVAVASSGWFDSIGGDVSPLGDVNVDGADDLAVSQAYEGIRLYFGGSENSGPITPDEADVVLAPGFNGGCNVIGDLNGDGLPDIACGVYEASTVESHDTVVFFGRSDWPAVIDLEDADVRIRGTTGEETLQFDSSTVGDIDGDGMDELVLAARYEDWNGVTQAGTVRVFRGRAAWPPEVERNDYDLLLYGDRRSYQQLGDHNRFVLTDIDGDGADDMVSSLREETRNTTFIFFGEPER